MSELECQFVRSSLFRNCLRLEQGLASKNKPTLFFCLALLLSFRRQNCHVPQLMGCCPQVVNLLLANLWLLQSVLVYHFPLCSCTNFSRDIHQLYHNCWGYMSSTQVGAHSAEVGVDALGYFLWTYWVPFLHGDPAKLAAHGIQSSLHGGSHDQSQQTSRDVHDGSALSPMKWNARWVALLKSPDNQAGKGHLQCCPRPGQHSPDPPLALSRSIGEDIGHAPLFRSLQYHT